MSGFRLFQLQCRRELLLQRREPRNWLFSALFFAMITVFFPLTIAPDPMLLRQMAAGVLWTALLLTFLLASERLFQSDYQEGVIEQWLVSGQPVPVYILAKMVVYWLVNVLPILSLCPFMGALFHLSGYECVVVMLSFVLATPVMVLLCALAAAFCTSMQQKGVLIALILWPLVIPVMIFGSGALHAAMLGLPVTGYLAILLALSILAVACLPFAIAAIVRVSLVD